MALPRGLHELPRIMGIQNFGTPICSRKSLRFLTKCPTGSSTAPTVSHVRPSVILWRFRRRGRRTVYVEVIRGRDTGGQLDHANTSERERVY